MMSIIITINREKKIKSQKTRIHTNKALTIVVRSKVSFEALWVFVEILNQNNKKSSKREKSQTKTQKSNKNQPIRTRNQTKTQAITEELETEIEMKIP